MTASEMYEGREQSLVKHRILRSYLERFAYIVGQRFDSISYVDCFAGPWKSRSEDYGDTSFAIAIRELSNARTGLQKQGRSKLQRLRAFFLERNSAAYAELRRFADGVSDVAVETKNATLEESISDIQQFAHKGGTSNFTFLFVDPTGWTGFALDTIRPLLQLPQSEVLINFMTQHISRFIESPHEETQESFVRLFGSQSFRQRILGLTHQQREQACVEEYMKIVQSAGNFTYASHAVVLHPLKDRTHFHLIYLTRNAKGIEVFKDAEKKSIPEMDSVRAKAQQDDRKKRTGQREMFAPDEMIDSSYIESLRSGYGQRARTEILSSLKDSGRMAYDDAWRMALRLPLVTDSDLKKWIKDWRSEGVIRLEGLQPTERVPKLAANHILIAE